MSPLFGRATITVTVLVAAARSCRGRPCGVEEINARDITGCTSVEHVKFLGHTNAVWLGDQLHHNPDLEFLDLHHTKLGEQDAISLAAGLENNTKLKRLGTSQMPVPFCVFSATPGWPLRSRSLHSGLSPCKRLSAYIYLRIFARGRFPAAHSYAQQLPL